MKKLIVLFIIIFSAATAQAQYTIQGSIADTMSVRNIPYASVSLLRADSTLLQTVRSG